MAVSHCAGMDSPESSGAAIGLATEVATGLPILAVTQARAAMIAALRNQGIRDESVLRVLAALPRDAFVDAAQVSRVHEVDRSSMIGYGQTISMPAIMARMTELLFENVPRENVPHANGRRDNVLEIGTGSGYQTAVLASLAETVRTIERIAPLQQRAKQALARLGFDNIAFKEGDGHAGWTALAPFDAIMVTAAATHVPPALCEQLAVHGRMVIPVGFNRQQLYVIDRTEAGFTQRAVCDVRFVPMVEDQR